MAFWQMEEFFVRLWRHLKIVQFHTLCDHVVDTIQADRETSQTVSNTNNCRSVGQSLFCSRWSIESQTDEFKEFEDLYNLHLTFWRHPKIITFNYQTMIVGIWTCEESINWSIFLNLIGHRINFGVHCSFETLALFYRWPDKGNLKGLHRNVDSPLAASTTLHFMFIIWICSTHFVMVSMVAGLSISCALVLAEGVQSAKHSACNLLAFVRSLHWHWPVGALY